MRSTLTAWWNQARAAWNAYRARLQSEPRRVLFEAFAAAAVVVTFICFLLSWWHTYAPALTDPNLQTDDARTALFPFHRYAPGHPLANDPIANEMIVYQPPAFRLLYRLTVPLVGLLWSAKIAQLVCLAIVVWAAVVLFRSRRAGLGSAALFLMLMLRDTFVMDRIGGGLPRSFGFPAMSLWFAGAIAHDLRARRSAAAIAALTYPSALAMVLGAEGIYALRRIGRPGFHTTLRRLKHYLALVGVCATLFAPTVLLGSSEGGPVHTLEQAQHEPAFSKAGRLWLLPLGDPGTNFGKQIVRSVSPQGNSPWPSLLDTLHTHRDEVAAVFFGVLLMLPLLGFSPPPGQAVAFAAASLIIYAVSVLFAFRLYSPERYYSYGMHMTVIGLITCVFGVMLPRLRRFRAQVRNLGAAACIFVFWSWLGDGTPSRNVMAMTINYQKRAPLWEFIKRLPQDVRIASFISDGDDIPLFAQRANNGGFETMQPWLTLSWARQKARAEDTLRAFYATDRRVVLDYARKYKVTHLLVNENRYRSDFVRRARTFQPLTDFSNELLANRKLDDLVLRDVPEDAVIFEYASLLLVDVAKLEKAWRAER